MKYRWDKKYLYWGITILLVIISSIGFYYLLFHGSNIRSSFKNIVSISMPILNGLGLAYLLSPVLNVLERKIVIPVFLKHKKELTSKRLKRIRAISIVLTMFIVLIVAYGFLSLVIPEIIKSIQSIIFQFPLYVNNLTNWIGGLLSDNPDIEILVTDLFSTYSSQVEKWINLSLLPQINGLIKTLSLSVLGLLMSFWNLIIGFILSIYILSSKELLTGQSKKIMYALFEKKTANSFITDVRFAHRTFSGFLGGKIVDSIIIGILCFIGTNMMGTPYAVLISVIVGVTNVIPFFGPYLGAIPSSILILMIEPRHCLYFIIFIFLLQQFDGNILGPKILGDSTGLSSFWVICSITVFGGLFGIFGMFIGVPTFAVIYAGFKGLFNRMLIKKGLTADTNQYIPLDQINREEQFVNMLPATPNNMFTAMFKKKTKSNLSEPLSKQETPDDSTNEKNSSNNNNSSNDSEE